MKKPNITQGPWEKVAPHTIGNVLLEQDICKVYTTKGDMQAIEAVPEMKGALLEAHKVLSKMNYNPEAKEINRLHHGVKFALKKAGVEL